MHRRAQDDGCKTKTISDVRNKISDVTYNVTSWRVHVTTVCHRNPTVRSLCIAADLHIAVNNIKSLSVAMQAQI